MPAAPAGSTQSRVHGRVPAHDPQLTTRRRGPPGECCASTCATVRRCSSSRGSPMEPITSSPKTKAPSRATRPTPIRVSRFTASLHLRPGIAQQVDRAPPQADAAGIIQPGGRTRGMRQGQDRCARRQLPGERLADQVIEPGLRPEREPMRQPADQQHQPRPEQAHLLLQDGCPDEPGRRATAASRPKRPAGDPDSTCSTLVTYQRSRKSSRLMPGQRQPTGEPLARHRGRTARRWRSRASPGACPISMAALGPIAGQHRRRSVRAARHGVLEACAARCPPRRAAARAPATRPTWRTRFGARSRQPPPPRSRSASRRSSAIASRRTRRTPSCAGPACSSASVSASRAA